MSNKKSIKKFFQETTEFKFEIKNWVLFVFFSYFFFSYPLF